MAEIPNMEEEEDEYQTRVDVCLTKEEALTQADEPIEYQATLDGEDENSVYQNNFRSCGVHEEIVPEIKRETSGGVNIEAVKCSPGSLSDYRVRYGLQLDDVEEEVDLDTVHNGEETRDESNKTIKVNLKQPHSMDVDRSITTPQQEQNDDDFEEIAQKNNDSNNSSIFRPEEFK